MRLEPSLVLLGLLVATVYAGVLHMRGGRTTQGLTAIALVALVMCVTASFFIHVDHAGTPDNNQMQRATPLGSRAGYGGVDAAASCSPFGERRRHS
jgi:hypothetical protein